jgi:hypothetical protein
MRYYIVGKYDQLISDLLIRPFLSVGEKFGGIQEA